MRWNCRQVYQLVHQPVNLNKFLPPVGNSRHILEPCGSTVHLCFSITSELILFMDPTLWGSLRRRFYLQKQFYTKMTKVVVFTNKIFHLWSYIMRSPSVSVLLLWKPFTTAVFIIGRPSRDVSSFGDFVVLSQRAGQFSPANSIISTLSSVHYSLWKNVCLIKYSSQ